MYGKGNVSIREEKKYRECCIRQVTSFPKKKRSSQKFFKRSPQKNVLQKIFQALHEILTIQKIVLSSSRGQANFRGLEASKPRPRTSKCVLEAKDVLEDSTSGLEMALAPHMRPRAVIGAPRRAAWQLKSVLRHSAAYYNFFTFFYNYCR